MKIISYMLKVFAIPNLKEPTINWHEFIHIRVKLRIIYKAI